MPPDPSATAILLVAHGSRNPTHLLEAERLRGLLEARLGRAVHLSYLEIGDPSFSVELAKLASEFPRVCVVPLLLFASHHATSDVPEQIQSCRASRPSAKIALLEAIGADPGLAELARLRLRQKAEVTGFPVFPLQKAAEADGQFSKAASIYLFHGSCHTKAKAEMQRQAELFFARTSFSLKQAAFLSRAEPSFESALEGCHEKGARQIYVALHLLFSGRIRTKTEEILMEFQRRHPDVSCILAEPLGADPVIADLLVKRLRECQS